MKSFLIMIVSLARAGTAPFSDSKCRGLSFQGGGDRASFEVGALTAIVEHMKPEETTYDVIEGVSAGAINTCLLAKWPKGTETEALKYMKQVWMDNPVKTLWKHWPIPVLGGLFNKSWLDSQPLKAFVENKFKDKEMKRAISITTVDLNSGKQIVFDETASNSDLLDGILGSATFPTMFTQVDHQQQSFVDGGLFANAEIHETINRCREEGFKDSDIIIDVIRCDDIRPSPEVWSRTDYTEKHSFDLYKRMKDFRYFNIFHIGDFVGMLPAYRDVNFRHVIIPTVPLDSGPIPLFGGKETIEKFYQQGYRDGTMFVKKYLQTHKNEARESE